MGWAKGSSKVAGPGKSLEAKGRETGPGARTVAGQTQRGMKARRSGQRDLGRMAKRRMGLEKYVGSSAKGNELGEEGRISCW